VAAVALVVPAAVHKLPAAAEEAAALTADQIVSHKQQQVLMANQFLDSFLDKPYPHLR